MTRARNLSGLSTVTGQPTTTTPVNLGPLGVGTFARIYGTWEQDQINAVGVAATNLQVSGITTGLNVSGIITAQNGLNVNGNIVNGLNVSAGIATFAGAIDANSNVDIAGNLTVAGTTTYEDLTDVDSIGVGTFRKGIIVAGVSTFSSDVSIADKIIHTGDTNTAIRFPSADTFTVETSGTEAIRVDSSQRLLIGTTDVDPVSDGEVSKLIIKGTDSTAGASFTRHSANAGGTGIFFGKSRNATIGSNTIVQSGDELGRITFSGDDGTNLNTQGAQIAAHVDGTPGENDMPGRLQFYTTADGAASVTERLRITSAGELLLGSTASAIVGGGGASLYQIETTTQNAISCVSHRGTGNASGSILILGKSRGTSAGAVTVVASGDELGALRFAGADGTDLQSRGAEISGEVDGTPGSNDMPGRLLFKTTADGASSSTERMRIDSDGQIGIGNIDPDTWSTGKSITIGTSQATLWGAGDQVNLSGNAYFNSGWKAAATKAGASQIEQALGNIDFRVSGSVTADAAITWIDALRITSAGKVGINYTSPDQAVLEVRGAQAYASSANSLATSVTKSAFRVRGSNDSSDSLWMGVETSAANPYIQASNNPGTTTRLLLLNPFGGYVGISTAYGLKGYLDIASAGAAGKPSLVLGANNSSTTNTTRTDGTDKAARIGCAHQTNGEEPFNIIYAVAGASSANAINYGGGTSWMNAATTHKFYTAANTTTTTGTERFSIGNDGTVSVTTGTISAIAKFQLYGSGNASDALADNLRFHHWGDANGDYWQMGANFGLDASGNSSKPSNTLKGAAVMVDGRGGRIYLKTSPASTSTTYEGLVVDELGRVRKPNNPAFVAYGSGGNTTYSGIIGLTQTNVNRNTCYDTSTNVGRFTAPVAGIYLFHFGCFPNSTSTCRVELRVNGTAYTAPYISGIHSNMGSGFPMPSGGQIMNLSAGDYVEVATNGDLTNTYNGHTGFSGVLLG